MKPSVRWNLIETILNVAELAVGPTGYYALICTVSFPRLAIQNEIAASIGMQQRRGYSAFSSRDLSVANGDSQIPKFDRSHI